MTGFFAKGRKFLLAAGVIGAGAAGAAWLWRHQTELAVRRPINEWTFTHMNWLLPTETVSRSQVPTALPQRPLQLEAEITYDFDRPRSLADLHERTHTTSFLVLHRGDLVYECYPGRFSGPETRHQLFSLTKSVTSLLIGIAHDRGVLPDLDAPVAEILSDLRGSAFDGPTIRQLLHMTSGVGGVEDWTIPDALISRFEHAVTNGHNVLEVIRGAAKEAEPGERFNYSTVDTHVLGLVLEAAAGKPLARLASEWLWNPIGAEHDGYYFLTRGRPQTALGGGSLNATPRDLARIGCLMAAGGQWEGEQVVPAEWAELSRDAGLPQLEVGHLGEGAYLHYGYSNQWWTLGGERRAFTGLGVHGQYLWVDPEADVVIVKTSAWTTADDEVRDRETVAACRAIVDYLDSRS